jgi:hypothetical protein
MSNPTPLFNSLSPRGEEGAPCARPASPVRAHLGLLDDLSTLVSLGLISERSTPEGPVYELTDLGRSTPEFRS